MRWMILAGLLVAGSAAAQDYRCMDDRGEYWSTTPCRAGEEHPGTKRQAPARQSSSIEITSEMEIDGATYCGVAVEQLARVDFKWTSWMGRFRGNPSNVGDGTIMFSGDEIEMQNGFGNWIRHKYVCVYDPIAKKVVDVGAEPGRF